MNRPAQEYQPSKPAHRRQEWYEGDVYDFEYSYYTNDIEVPLYYATPGPTEDNGQPRVIDIDFARIAKSELG